MNILLAIFTIATFRLIRLAALLPTTALSAAATTAEQRLPCQDIQLIQPQMHSCLLLVAHSLVQSKFAPRLPDSLKDGVPHQIEDAADVRLIFWTSLVVVKAAVLALEVYNQNAGDCSAMAQLWMSVHAAARWLQAHDDQQQLLVSGSEKTEARFMSAIMVQLLLPTLRLSLARTALYLESNTCRISCHMLHAVLAQCGEIAHAAAKEINTMGKRQCHVFMQQKQAAIVICGDCFALS